MSGEKGKVALEIRKRVGNREKFGLEIREIWAGSQGKVREFDDWKFVRTLMNVVLLSPQPFPTQTGIVHRLLKNYFRSISLTCF